MSVPTGKHAVVVGAGMGGLAAAKTLSAHFERVTVLERDALPQAPAPRQGTPQGRHAHVLLAGGRRALTALFPHLEQELEQAGAIRIRVGLDANLDEFMTFARELRTPAIYNAIRNAKPLGDVVRYGLPASIRRHYERLARFPRGLLPIADLVCRFNPVFGQGMSVAAQEADALRRLLEARAALPNPLDGLAPAFFAEIQPLLAAPWSTAETDFVYPQTRGDCPADFAQRMQYAAALTRLARRMRPCTGLLPKSTAWSGRRTCCGSRNLRAA